ncbi:MAG: hypothetical protein ACK45B_14325 [Limisphaerales bacterium]
MDTPAPIVPVAPDLTGVVTAVFAAWREGGIEFVVLRNYERLPQFTSHDVDVLVRPRDLAAAERALVAACRSAGYHLSNRAEFATVSFFFFHPETLAQIQFDLFTRLSWRSFDLLSTEAVLQWRRPRGMFAVPHPVHEAVNNLLSRQIYHGYVKDAYRSGIGATLAEYPQELPTLLRRLFGDKVGRRLAARLEAQDWDGVEALTAAMRWQVVWRGLVFQPTRTLGNFSRDVWRLAWRWCHPPGMKIVLLGADGSGKSTVAQRVLEALHGTFYRDKSRHVHWKPAVFLRRRRANRPPTRDPHGQPPRGWFASQLALLYHWTEFLAGSLLQNRPVRFRAGLVLIERHHYDFEADPLRYRLRPPCGLVRWLFRRLPAPDLVFVLDAPAEVLHARKPELTLEETRRQREAYLKIVLGLPQGRVVDATQPLDAVVRAVVHQVLERAEARQRRRYPLP